MEIIEKPFSDCTLSYLEDTFGIRSARTTADEVFIIFNALKSLKIIV